MHIVEIYKHNGRSLRGTRTNQEHLIDLVSMLQNYDKCLQVAEKS